MVPLSSGVRKNHLIIQAYPLIHLKPKAIPQSQGNGGNYDAQIYH